MSDDGDSHTAVHTPAVEDASEPDRAVDRTDGPSSPAPASAASLLSPSLSSSERTSFVYPARSLLSKDIQPAMSPPADDRPRSPFSQRRPTSLSRRTTNSATDGNDTDGSVGSSAGRAAGGRLPTLMSAVGGRTQPSSAVHDSRNRASVSPPSSPSRNRRQLKKEDTAPSLDQTMAPAAFATSNSAAVALTQLVGQSTGHQAMSLLPPSHSLLASRREGRSPDVSRDADYFSTPDDSGGPDRAESPGREVSPPDADADNDRPSLSMAGIVHLGPRNNSNTSLVRSRGRSMRSGSPGGEPSDSSGDRDSSRMSPPQRPESAAGTDEQLIVTQRFQYVTDADGHHVVTGREGVLTRCEDEPIRTPGAVQGFGVLIAIEEEMETGNFVVRQVSEVGVPVHPCCLAR
jgi:hypothetical protein